MRNAPAGSAAAVKVLETCRVFIYFPSLERFFNDSRAILFAECIPSEIPVANKYLYHFTPKENPLNHLHLTRAMLLEPFLKVLMQRGVDPVQHLDACNLNRRCLEDGNTLIPLHYACGMIGRASRREGIPDLGILAGRGFLPQYMGGLGKELMSCCTLYEMLPLLAQRIHVLDSGVHAWMETVPGSGDMRLFVQQETEVGQVQADTYNLMLMINIIRLGTGYDWWPAEIQIMQKTAPAFTAYEELSTAIKWHGKRAVSVRVPETFLSRPLQTGGGEEDAAAVLSPFVEQPLGRLEEAMQACLPHHLLSLEEAAELCGVSARSLQRVLSEEGTSFRRMQEKVRYRKAENLLRNNMSVSEVAYEIGYSAPQNFYRAFRRWTGLTPEAYIQSMTC